MRTVLAMVGPHRRCEKWIWPAAATPPLSGRALDAKSASRSIPGLDDRTFDPNLSESAPWLLGQVPGVDCCGSAY
jgi:hypothetical protein